MSENPQAGTPEATPVVSESAGSAVGATDGSETAKGLAGVDPALAAEWKSKAEKYNKAEEEAKALKAQLEAIQRQQQQGQDPRYALAVNLQERAPYDPDAAAQLQLLHSQVIQEREMKLQEDMFLHNVPREAWAQVKGLVQQSNYQLSVPAALASVVPPKDTAMESEVARLRAEIEQLKAPKKVLGASAGAASTVPAAPPTTASEELMPLSQYKAIQAAGGPKAKETKGRKDAGLLSLDYSA